MGIIVWIILGGVAGWLASLIVKETESRGCVANVLVGIGGAVLGGLIFRGLGGSGVSGINVWSLFVAVVGAAILLSIIRAFRGK